MPWRTRTARPLSLRDRRIPPESRPPIRFAARRIPDGESYTDRPLWQLAHMTAEAREKLAALEPVCAPWEARLVDEEDLFGFVLIFRPWPRDLRIWLSDDPQMGEACPHTPVVVLTRHSATGVWGGSEHVGFEALADAVYDAREAQAAPDIDALHSLVPQSWEPR